MSIFCLILPVTKHDYVVYANPTSNVFNFDFNHGYQTNKSIEIVDLTGQKVYKVITEKDLYTLETKSLIEGLYLVKVNFLDENRSTEIKRLVIQK